MCVSTSPTNPTPLLVPQVALGSGQLGRFVYVVGKDGKAEQRIVSPGATYGGHTERRWNYGLRTGHHETP